MEMLKDKLKNMYRTSLLFSIILFFVGLFLIMRAETTLNVISYIVGVMLILWGVIPVITFFSNKENNNYLNSGFILGVFSLIIGVIVLINPKIIASIIPFVIGIWMIINGVTKLYYSLMLNKEKNATTAIVISLAILVCGIFLVANPFKGAEILTQIIGASIMVYAVLDIVECITIKKVVKSTAKEVKDKIKVIEADYEETK